MTKEEALKEAQEILGPTAGVEMEPGKWYKGTRDYYFIFTREGALRTFHGTGYSWVEALDNLRPRLRSVAHDQ